MSFAAALKKTSNLRELLSLSKTQIDKYSGVFAHLQQQHLQLDSGEDGQFGPVFEEFKKILETIVSSNPNNEKLVALQAFNLNLLDSVEQYIKKKEELQQIGKIEGEDFLARISKMVKDFHDGIQLLEKTLKGLEARIQSENLQTSLRAYEDKRDERGSHTETRTSQTLSGGLFTLRKTLNSPRENSASREDLGVPVNPFELRDLKKENNELLLAKEALKQQLEAMKSELDDKNGSQPSPSIHRRVHEALRTQSQRHGPQTRRLLQVRRREAAGLQREDLHPPDHAQPERRPQALGQQVDLEAAGLRKLHQDSHGQN